MTDRPRNPSLDTLIGLGGFGLVIGVVLVFVSVGSGPSGSVVSSPMILVLGVVLIGLGLLDISLALAVVALRDALLRRRSE